MTLSALIRKRDTGNLATAIPAIAATQSKGGAATVARIATVAVANSPEVKTNLLSKVGNAKILIKSTWWLIHYIDSEPLEVCCAPEASHTEILEHYPNAVAAEPFTPSIRQPSAPLTASEEAAIRAWLALIEETDPATIAEVIERCQRDADARCYFIARATAELPKSDVVSDDRRTCEQCENLIARRCQAAKRGKLVANPNYEPIRDQPRRCEGYAPRADDTDQRPGSERWPGLA